MTPCTPAQARTLAVITFGEGLSGAAAAVLGAVAFPHPVSRTAATPRPPTVDMILRLSAMDGPPGVWCCHPPACPLNKPCSVAATLVEPVETTRWLTSSPPAG